MLKMIKKSCFSLGFAAFLLAGTAGSVYAEEDPFKDFLGDDLPLAAPAEKSAPPPLLLGDKKKAPAAPMKKEDAPFPSFGAPEKKANAPALPKGKVPVPAFAGKKGGPVLPKGKMPAPAFQGKKGGAPAFPKKTENPLAETNPLLGAGLDEPSPFVTEDDLGGGPAERPSQSAPKPAFGSGFPQRSTLQAPRPMPNPQPPRPKKLALPGMSQRPSQVILGRGGKNIFQSMAELERQNALLSMELEREKLRSEIEAVKEARKREIQMEKERQEALTIQREEAEKALKQKLLLEQEALFHNIFMEEQALKEKLLDRQEAEKAKEFDRKKALEEIKLEQLKIEREMKEEIWKKEEAERRRKEEEAKKKEEEAKAKAAQATAAISLDAPEDVSSLSLDSRIFGRSSLSSFTPTLLSGAGEGAPGEGQQMGEGREFSGGGFASSSENRYSLSGPIKKKREPRAAELFVVTEIRGIGDDLVAKLKNTEDVNFYAREGTVLASGHIVLDIEKTHILVEKSGKKEVLGFSGGTGRIAGSDEEGGGSSSERRSEENREGSEEFLFE